MIQLPKSATVSIVVSYWSVVASIIFVIAISVYWLLVPSVYILGVGIFVSIVIVVLLFVRRDYLLNAYQIINGIIRIVIFPAARNWVSGAAFFTVLLVNRKYARGLQFTPARIDGTMWHSCFPPDTSTQEKGKDGMTEMEDDAFRGGNLYDWMAKTRNWWVVGLVPFMLLLSALQEDSKSAPPSDKYTLY